MSSKKPSPKRQARRKEGKSNPAGFRASDEGVFLDKHGNRRIYEVALTPEGEVLSRFGAHPVQVSSIFNLLMHEHVQSRAMILGAANRFKKEKRKQAFQAFFVRVWSKITKPFTKTPQIEPETPQKKPDISAEIAREKEAIAKSKLSTK